ncbi:MAG: GTP 3',8-cyclase MoaA [Alphaproteobacteria bacterium]
MAVKMSSTSMTDPFGRSVTYLRLSVTDRCDLRCTYCMAEEMEFLPKREVLSLEELRRLAEAFIRKGVKKIRLTGGEPLVRRNLMSLVETLGAHVGQGLEELTLTTNGTQLRRFAAPLKAAGVERINVSLDSLHEDRFRAITRRGSFAQVIDGIDAAQEAGLKVKLNTVALKGINEDEIEDLILFAHGRDMDLTLIETMPMGEVEHRNENYLSLRTVHERLKQRWTLTDLPDRTGGPARYKRIEETGGRLGYITPLSHNFCESCNRVRVTCTGQMFMCLGQEDQADLRSALRASEDDHLLDAAIDEAITRKPKGHDFDASRLASPSVSRHMSVTGG